MTDIGVHYREARLRLTGLLADAGDDDWEAPVPACPGWRAHDVVGHLVGVVEDALAGTLTGPPPPEVTAAQVARHRSTPRDALLARWGERAGEFEELVTALGTWPAAIDVASHEHDIRTAIGRPGARDAAVVTEGARALIEMLDLGVTVAFDLEDGTVLAGNSRDSGNSGDSGDSAPGAPGIRLRATSFEVFRFRLGRRSRTQVAALDWSRDPGDILDRLFVFGPAEHDLPE